MDKDDNGFPTWEHPIRRFVGWHVKTRQGYIGVIIRAAWELEWKEPRVWLAKDGVITGPFGVSDISEDVRLYRGGMLT